MLRAVQLWYEVYSSCGGGGLRSNVLHWRHSLNFQYPHRVKSLGIFTSLWLRPYTASTASAASLPLLPVCLCHQPASATGLHLLPVCLCRRPASATGPPLCHPHCSCHCHCSCHHHHHHRLLPVPTRHPYFSFYVIGLLFTLEITFFLLPSVHSKYVIFMCCWHSSCYLCITCPCFISLNVSGFCSLQSSLLIIVYCQSLRDIHTSLFYVIGLLFSLEITFFSSSKCAFEICDIYVLLAQFMLCMYNSTCPCFISLHVSSFCSLQSSLHKLLSHFSGLNVVMLN